MCETVKLPVGRIHKTVIQFLLFFIFTWQVTAQEKINNHYNYPIKKAVDKIKVDGVLDEASWTAAYVAGDFFMVQPMDTSFAVSKTEAMMTYDESNIYISAVNYSLVPGKYVVESMKREYAFNANDNFFVCFDTYNDLTNGFIFGLNAAGAQTDASQYDGGLGNYNWDHKWESAVKQFEDKWVLEIAIPFKTLRYKKGVLNWGVNFSRLDLKQKEKSAWAPMPTNFATATLAYAGNLVWDAPPPEPGLNVSLIPYFLGSAEVDREEGTPAEYKPRVGGDAKVSLTSALNLDMTINPDFSQVEVDRQVTNLSRFELFFPERRQFFLENSDLFANFGNGNYRPFFSRRIGLDSPIRFGGRISGKIEDKWRMGLMNVTTAENSDDASPAQNYTVAALQHYVFSRSNISAIFIDRESLGLDYTKHDSSFTRYNRNAGIEYNLSSKDNIWLGKFLLHKTFSPDIKDKDLLYSGALGYHTRRLSINGQYMNSGINYNPEVGYMPRTGFNHIGIDARYKFFVKSNWLLSHGPSVEYTDYFDFQWDQTDNNSVVIYELEFLDRSGFAIGYGFDYVKLLNPFDPTNSGGDSLAAGTDYNNRGWGFEYSSSPSNPFTFKLSMMNGGYYNGKSLTVEGNLRYRFQPYGSIAVDFSYNDIRLPEPYTSADFWLISPRLDITFTNSVFFTTFVQYNEQADNFNINSRFQWRFKPASDIFLVYTENYLPGDFTTKNRAVVLKLTYWYSL
jgi:hypothetical protein